MLTAARIILLLMVCNLIFIGQKIFLFPGEMSSMPNIALSIELTTMRLFGALYVGMGLIGIVALVKQQLMMPGLCALFILMSCVFVARLTGVLVDGNEPSQTNLLIEEFFFPALLATAILLTWLSGQRAPT